MRRFSLIFFAAVVCFMCITVDASAQFKKEAFTQTYNSDSLAVSDTVTKMVDFKEIFGGLAHKRTMRIGPMFGTSMVLPGTAQIYNKDYWKLPLFYSGMIGGVTSGIIYGEKFKASGNADYKTISTLSYVGAGVFYYASLMDGVINYESDRDPLPGRATIYSILCPGLGQAYNGEYWKMPVYIGGLAFAYYFYSSNKTNYVRYRDIYREASAGTSTPVSKDQAKYYRDYYRRYRDYGVLAMTLVYLLQVIDANVFCYMHDFDVSENLAMSVAPSVILPDNNVYAFNANPGNVATGMTLSFRF